MTAGSGVDRAAPRGRRSYRRFLMRAVPLSILVAAGVWYATDRYRVGIDDQLNPCLPDTRVVLIDTADHEVGLGELVAFTAHGQEPFISDGTTVVKMVLGMPGDRVVVGADFVWVNGMVVAEGLDLIGTLGRPAEDFTRSFIIPEGSVFPMGLTRDSYDGRYYGALSTASIIGQAWRLW